MPCPRAANPIWFFLDLVGLPLNDQYYISFLTNDFPYIPQPVFEDPNCSIPWANPLEFGPNGALPDNMYWPPGETWRLEIRQGPTQSDPLIYEINNFQPSPPVPTPNVEDIFTQDNQITNPQFAQIFFTNDLTITVAGTYNIAPGWNLVLTGGGTTVLTQLVLDGAQNLLTNPPFALKINNAGWSSAILEQTFSHNGAIWANGAISGLLTGRAESVNELISMNYVPSDAGTPVSIFTTTLTTANFQSVGGAVNLGLSTNTDLSDVANVQIQIVLPPTGVVDISNIQITGQTDPLQNPIPPSQIPSYNQETIERGIDHEFNWYAQQIIELPKRNILSGWVFGLNPYQFQNPDNTTVISNLTQYTADQTILHQETASSLASGQAGHGGLFGYQLTAKNGVNNNRFAIFQYVDAATILPYLGQKLSCMVRARIVTTHGTSVKIKMRLIYRSTAVPTISNTEPITGWDVNGDVTFAAGWTVLKPLNDPAYTLQNNYDLQQGDLAFPPQEFNQFSLPDIVSTKNATYVGVVVYTTGNINNSLGTEDQVLFDKISLTPNKFAIDANPITFDESLRQCQFYYEKSYLLADFATAVTNSQAQIIRLNMPWDNSSNISIMRFGSFTLHYKQTKRSIPTLNIYSNVTGTINNISGEIVRNATNPAPGAGTNPQDYVLSPTNYTVSQQTDQANFSCVSTTVDKMTVNPGDRGDEALITFQYVADARLGR